MLFFQRRRKPVQIKVQTMRFPVPEDGGCKYPIGDPRDVNFCFCNKKRSVTSPYCTKHEDLCYERKAASPEKRQKAIGRLKSNW